MWEIISEELKEPSRFKMVSKLIESQALPNFQTHIPFSNASSIFPLELSICCEVLFSKVSSDNLK
jgi:hypothetical protein